MNSLRLLHNKLGSLDAQLNELKHMLRTKEQEHERLSDTRSHWLLIAACETECQELEQDILEVEREIGEVEFDIRHENWRDDLADRYNSMKGDY